MFTLAKTWKFWWPVKVHVPRDGEIVVEEFQAQFVTMDDDEMAAWRQSMAEFLVEKQGALGADYYARDLGRIVVGWRDVEDDDGTSVPFTPENLRAAAAIPFVRDALYAAYVDGLSGKALEKNSATPPVPGPSPAPAA